MEFPLIAGLYLGLSAFFQDNWVMAVIGIAGGAMLIFMGQGMIRQRFREDSEEDCLPYHPFWVGIITSVSNPYLFLWWATVGILLITTAAGFGAWAVVMLAVVHWSCDLVWDAFVGFAAFRSRVLWTKRNQAIILGGCGIVLIGFGIYFMASPLLALA